MDAPWVKIRNEYINGTASCRELAEKYNISYGAIRKKSSLERWKDKRTKAAQRVVEKTLEKTQEKIAEKEANRMARILAAGDRLMEQLERASGELDRQMVRKKHTVRTVEYKDLSAKGKPTREIVDETENLEIVDGIIDRRGLQQLADALKSISAVQTPEKDKASGCAQTVIPDAIWRELMNPVYADRLTDEHATQIFFGGSSSGKSFAILAQRTVRDLMAGGRNYLICRKTARTIRGSCYNEITKCISRMELADQFRCNKSDMTVTCLATGTQAVFAGLDDVEKVKSITPTVGVFTDIVIEEATETDYPDYKQLSKRLRGGDTSVPKRMTLLFNPVLQDHWIYTEWFAGRWDETKHLYSDDQLLILHTTYKDNRYLTREDIDKLENETDKYYYDVYTLGHWGVLGKLIFTNWEIRDLSEQAKHEDRQRNGMDFGFWPDPNAFVQCGYDKRKREVYVYRTAGGNEQDSEAMAAMIKPLVGRGVVRCDIDNFKIQELCLRGINAIPAYKGLGSIEYGIEWLQRMKIYIDPGCTDLIAEMRKYKYKEDRDGNILPQPVDKDNHFIDGLRYSLEEDILATKVS